MAKDLFTFDFLRDLQTEDLMKEFLDEDTDSFIKQGRQAMQAWKKPDVTSIDDVVPSKTKRYLQAVAATKKDNERKSVGQVVKDAQAKANSPGNRMIKQAAINKELAAADKEGRAPNVGQHNFGNVFKNGLSPKTADFIKKGANATSTPAPKERPVKPGVSTKAVADNRAKANAIQDRQRKDMGTSPEAKKGDGKDPNRFKDQIGFSSDHKGTDPAGINKDRSSQKRDINKEKNSERPSSGKKGRTPVYARDTGIRTGFRRGLQTATRGLTNQTLVRSIELKGKGY